MEKQKRKRHKVKTNPGRPWPEIPLEERKIMVYCTVKRKYWNQAMIAIKELCNQWR